MLRGEIRCNRSDAQKRKTLTPRAIQGRTDGEPWSSCNTARVMKLAEWLVSHSICELANLQSPESSYYKHATLPFNTSSDVFATPVSSACRGRRDNYSEWQRYRSNIMLDKLHGVETRIDNHDGVASFLFANYLMYLDSILAYICD